MSETFSTSASSSTQAEDTSNQAARSEEDILTIVTEDDESVPSHDKTPLPQYRSNPAICIQEYLADMDSPACQGLLHNSIQLSRRYSTERYEHYTESAEKVKHLLDSFSEMIMESMPNHAQEAIESDGDTIGTKPAEVLLVRGIIAAGNTDYEDAIGMYKRVLRACEGEAVRFRELRVSTLHHIGICYCLMGKFAEAERYYQFAQDEYAKDQELVNHNISNYSILTAASGGDLKSSLPIDRYLQSLSMEQTETEDVTTGGSVSSDDHGDTKLDRLRMGEPMKKKGWFPESKEELLDYSAAYIQLMIMGGEMVKRRQDATRPGARRK